MAKNEILLLESRSPQDIFDERCEAIALKESLKLQGVQPKHLEVINKSLLAKALKYAEKQHIRYVHISAHGSPEGFQLTDGEFVYWKEFDEIAWPYLKDTCLCFSSCYVGQGADELFNFHKSFCNAIVAPTRPIGWGESLVAYSAFYHRALSTVTTTAQDVKVLNHIVGAGSFKLIESPYRSTTYAIGS
ncbi:MULTISPECIES: hypothetical protein [Aeromonas]|uniref:hypothetical protein n=1 Tax=Aeromonas TaxID=642 RepID=UPI0018CD3526|nr:MULTISPECIES: hypothetical protein [Aeromonas]